mmetsp:Transcript_44239/g.116260  ORF Transcript_44239/g.116260 Transcript_44239/m.116260 type:complete len:225 (-) Transcript_44239:315-989(-)
MFTRSSTLGLAAPQWGTGWEGWRHLLIRRSSGQHLLDAVPYLLGRHVCIHAGDDTGGGVVRQDGHRLLVVALQPLGERLLGVVSALHERLASLIVKHRLLARCDAVGERLGLCKLNVVRATRCFVHPPTADALSQNLVGHLKSKHQADLNFRSKHIVKHLGLLHGARETIKDKSFRAVVLLDALADYRHHELVGDEATRGHNVLRLHAHLRAGCNSSTEHVTRR